MLFYVIVIKSKANRKNLQYGKEQSDFKRFYTWLHDNFVLEGLSQQWGVTDSLAEHHKNPYC